MVRVTTWPAWRISKLRQKIDAEAERPLLRTVRNAGYTVTADD
ncbi:MAG: helix-turn-helix domain-containing protein [Steroidobacteraceae bacterium]